MEKRKPDKKNAVFIHGLYWGPQIATQPAMMGLSSLLANGHEYKRGCEQKVGAKGREELTGPLGDRLQTLLLPCPLGNLLV